jgi:hypothetical protein
MVKQQNSRRFNLFIALGAVLILVLVVNRHGVSAQVDEAWTIPVNVSRSGAATNPLTVIDQEENVHAFWLENEREFAYARTQAGVWQESKAIEPPFASRVYLDLNDGQQTPIYIPTLVTDNANKLYAFWVNEEDALEFSDIAASAVETAGIFDWRRPVTLASNALAVAAASDAAGRIHVVYVRSAESDDFPAGIYHKFSADSGDSWSESTLLLPSRYFRAAVSEDMHIGIESADDTIYVVWDSRPEEKVFFVKSDDAGTSWGEPLEVDAREIQDGSTSDGPSEIVVSSFEDEVILVWRANHDNLPNCGLYYQTSSDRGSTWTERQHMTNFFGCPTALQFVTTNAGNSVLVAPGPELSYLMSWDRTRWSDPQRESHITGFSNAGTFRPVELGCHQSAYLSSDALLLMGCDVGSSSDVWALQRSLEDIGTWFPAPTDWRVPDRVHDDVEDLSAAAMVTDTSGRVHLAWSSRLDAGIQYSRKAGESWSTPVEVLRSPNGRADDPALAIDNAERLLAVWADPESGDLYFSQVDSERSAITAEWSTPLVIASSDSVASSPQIVIGDANRIVVAYAVPLNEGRGVFAVESADNGVSWSQPVTLFDAAAAGWTMVDDPTLHIGPNGKWHLLWTQYTVPGTGGPIALFYAQSTDEGETWREAELVTDTPVLWSRVATTSDQTVHRVWQGVANDLVTLWHQQSDDGGLTWLNPNRVSSFGDAAGAPTLVKDDIGRLHLLQLQPTGLHYWVLDDSGRWVGDSNIGIVPRSADAGQLLVDLDADGGLVVVYLDSITNQFGEQGEDALFFTQRALEYPEGLPTPVPTATPVPNIVRTATPTPGPEPTPTLAFSTDAPASPTAGTSSRVIGLVLGLVAALVFVVLAFVIGLGVTNSRRR